MFQNSDHYCERLMNQLTRAKRKLESVATKLVHAGREPEEFHGAVNPPVYRTSTVVFKTQAERRQALSTADRDVYRYGRQGTPTRYAYESAIASLYGAEKAIAVPSGLAAVSLALQSLVKAGDHILLGDNCYAPARLFADNVLSRYGVTVGYFDTTDPGDLNSKITENTALVFVETPGTFTFELADLPVLTEITHANAASFVIDNTWATALGLDPFSLGVDLVVEAATKYIGGHSDIMSGVVVGNGEIIDRAIAEAHFRGDSISGDEAYLGLRGLRTMAVRMEQIQKNTLKVAEWLEGRPEVTRVLYPALPSHPQHDLFLRDYSMAAGVFSIEIEKSHDRPIEPFVDEMSIFGIGASWGGFESLILEAPNMADIRTATGWADKTHLIRFNIGLENPDDLTADLEAGFERLKPK